MPAKFFVLFAISVLAAACSTAGTDTANKPAPPNSNVSAVDALSNNSQKAAADANAAHSAALAAGEPTLAECYRSKVAGKVLVREQTFVFDHKPYEKSCFVTFANPDEMVDKTDVPRGSTFHIFTNGENMFEFPDAFNGQTACWVEALSFDDLNKDGQTDVIMSGRCLGAKDSYPTNAIFVNVGKGFSTNEEANAELDDLENIQQIRTFVGKNLKRFF
ncbi:MAG TPA: hypothetical protein PLR83_06850 [Pyrinomonadaceae bacterium]|nr:hypothetical protein [Pyrinomonadaceae bacterium]